MFKKKRRIHTANSSSVLYKMYIGLLSKIWFSKQLNRVEWIYQVHWTMPFINWRHIQWIIQVLGILCVLDQCKQITKRASMSQTVWPKDTKEMFVTASFMPDFPVTQAVDVYRFFPPCCFFSGWMISLCWEQHIFEHYLFTLWNYEKCEAIWPS